MSHTPEDFSKPNGNGQNGHANGHASARSREELNQLLGQAEDTDNATDDALDPKALWSAIADSRWLVISITAAGGILALLFCLTTRMQFVVDGSLYLGDTQSQKLGGLEMLDMLGSLGQSEVGTELEVVKSRSLIRKAILDSGLNVDVVDESIGVVRMWRWRLSRRDFHLLQPRVQVHNADISDPALVDKTLMIVFEQRGQYAVYLKERRLGEGTVGQQFTHAGLTMVIDASEGVGDLQGQRFKLRVAPVDWMLENVRKTLRATVPKAPSMTAEVAVIELSFEDSSPYRAAGFLNALMRSYLDQHLSWKTEEATATVKFVDAQMVKIRASLDAAEAKLASFKKDSGMVILSEEAKAIIDAQSTLESSKIDQRLYDESLNNLSKTLNKPDAPIEDYLVNHPNDTVLNTLSRDLTNAQLELRRLEQQYTEDAPAMREQRAVVQRQRDLIAKYVTEIKRRSSERLRGVDRQIKMFNDKLKTLPAAELQLAAFTREVEVFSKIYSFLLEKQAQAELTKASTISKSRFLDAAMVPWRESGPKFRLIVPGGLLVGLFIAFFVLYVQHKLSFTFRSDEELRRFFANVPLFGTVPHRQVKENDAALGDNPAQTLFEDNLRSGFAEAYRLLRTNLYYSSAAGSDRVLLISSPGPGDGKTLTTLSLGHTLAMDGKRVLIVDGDLRKPSHHALLRIPQHPGLTSILTGEIHWNQVVRTVFAVNRGRIDAIPTGIIPPNPAELLSNPELRDFLNEATEQYDFILFDSPPFPLVSDALVVAMCVDRCLSVLRVKKTRRGPADEHVRRLAAATNRYGIVINDVSVFSSYGYGYGNGYGYGGYGYGGQRDSKKRRSNVV